MRLRRKEGRDAVRLHKKGLGGFFLGVNVIILIVQRLLIVVRSALVVLVQELQVLRIGRRSEKAGFGFLELFSSVSIELYEHIQVLSHDALMH